MQNQGAKIKEKLNFLPFSHLARDPDKRGLDIENDSSL